MGKVWGSECEKCFLFGIEVFREICFVGYGYIYVSFDICLFMRKVEEEELVRFLRE